MNAKSHPFITEHLAAGRRRGKRKDVTMNHPHAHRRGPKGRGPGRTRRGTAARAALHLLAERPMHGYEIIAEIDARTEGRWRPSAGSIYPALARLEERGLISGHDDGNGKREYTLTDAGRERIAAVDPDAPTPWDEAAGAMAEEGRGDLRAAMAEIGGQVRQLGRFGAPAKRAAALEILDRTRTDLYRLLAEPNDSDEPGDDNETDGD